MATEVVNIEINERGAREVKRNIDEIAKSSNKTASSVDFVRKALQLLGGSLAIRQVARFADEFTNLQNRLRATGLEGKALTGIYKQLLQVSNETRSGVQGSVELYSRLAIASKELGTTQQQLISFTKSLNQAIILSGASATEAQAGLIQLSQGLASGTLRGDELRSVLEQLPVVADVIAKELGVTRGELRLLGSEGKITARDIITAFQSAEKELNEKFGKTIPTIGQSLIVLRNNALDAFGALDKNLGASATISQGILFLANNMDSLVSVIGDLVRVLAIATSGYIAFHATIKAQAILTAISSFIEYRKAIAAGTVVVLGSAEAERQKSLALAQSAQAQAASSAGALAAARSENVLAASKLRSIQLTKAQLIADRELLLSYHAHIISASGRARSLTKIAEVRRAELAISKLITKEEQAYAITQATVSAAEKARAASLANLAVAQKANSAATASAARSTTLLGQALTFARLQINALTAAIAANPIGFLLVALTVTITALTIFRDKIKIGSDELTTLGDVMRALGEDFKVVFGFIKNLAQNNLVPVINLIKKFVPEFDFSIVGVLRILTKGLDSYIGAWSAAAHGTIELFKGLLPALGDLFTQTINYLLKKISDFVNTASSIINPLLEKLGKGTIAEINLEFGNEFEGKAGELGSNINKAMGEAFKNSNFFTNSLESTLTRASEIAKERVAKQLSKDLDELFASRQDLFGGGEKATTPPEKSNKEFEKILADLRARNDLLKLGIEDRKAGLQILELERKLEVQLTTEQRNSVIELQKVNEQLQLRANILDSVRQPQLDFRDSLQSINELLSSNQITLSENNNLIIQQTQSVYQSGIDSTNNFVESYKTALGLLNEYRMSDLGNEETYQKAKSELEKQYSKTKLEYAGQFFGNLAVLSDSGNKKLAAIGKAAAISQATIQGIVSVQNALAVQPYPVGVALAISAGVAAAANVAKIASSRALGGMLDAGQIANVGESSFNRPEIFQGQSGKQFFIPPERGNVIPFKETFNRRSSGGEQKQDINVQSAPAQVIVIDDPERMNDYLNSSQGEKKIVEIMRRNQ